MGRITAEQEERKELQYAWRKFGLNILYSKEEMEEILYIALTDLGVCDVK